MHDNRLTIATRSSPLALWQANWVKDALEKLHPSLHIQIAEFTTRGDILLDTPLAKVGGKGLFVKELEVAMLEDKADIAVHSMKDVPMAFPDGLTLATICEREVPNDAIVLPAAMEPGDKQQQMQTVLPELGQGARVGTSSLRRRCQLQALRPDLNIVDLRGNLNTRLRKLDEGQYDAIILAAAGLIRLGMQDRISALIPYDVSLPAGGQGAIGIECRVGDDRVMNWLAPLDHGETRLTLTAERAMNNRLQGGCQVPIAGFAQQQGDQLVMDALVGQLDGSHILRASGRCAANIEAADELGVELAEQLLNQGAQAILDSIQI